MHVCESQSNNNPDHNHIYIYGIQKFLNCVIMNKHVVQEETSPNTTPNPLARIPQSTFAQSHLTTETVPETNEAVLANNNEVVSSNNDEIPSSIQSNGSINTRAIQSRHILQNGYFIEVMD